MKKSIKTMTREERLIYIKVPLLMLLVCVSSGAVGLFVAIWTGQIDFAFFMWGVGAFLFVFGLTDWLTALKAWRNGESRKRGLEREK